MGFIIISSNTKNYLDILSAISPIVIGIIALSIAYYSNKISKKHLEQQKEQFIEQLKEEKMRFEYQFSEQKKQWANNSFIVKQNESWIELQNLYSKSFRSMRRFYLYLNPTISFSPFDNGIHEIRPSNTSSSPKDLLESILNDLVKLKQFLDDNSIYLSMSKEFYQYVDCCFQFFSNIFYYNISLFEQLLVKNSDKNYRSVDVPELKMKFLEDVIYKMPFDAGEYAGLTVFQKYPFVYPEKEFPKNEELRDVNKIKIGKNKETVENPAVFNRIIQSMGAFEVEQKRLIESKIKIFKKGL